MGERGQETPHKVGLAPIYLRNPHLRLSAPKRSQSGYQQRVCVVPLHNQACRAVYGGRTLLKYCTFTAPSACDCSYLCFGRMSTSTHCPPPMRLAASVGGMLSSCISRAR